MIGKHISNAIAPALFLASVALLVALSLGLCSCHLFKDSETPKLPSYCYDETELRVKIMACVAKSETKAASQECRKQVNKSCGIEETP